MIKCQVVVHVAAAAARQLFTRRKARSWIITQGWQHVLNQKCSHPECRKARLFIQRGVVYKNDWGSVSVLPVGCIPDPNQILKSKAELTVKP